MKCSSCGADCLNDATKFCEYCGSSVSAYPKSATLQSLPIITPPLADLSNLEPYYQQAFRQIDENSGKPKIIWNWAAFFLSGFWYFYKGMWAKGLIIFTVLIFSAGVVAPFAWLYSGLLGNYDYYLLKVKNNQFW